MSDTAQNKKSRLPLIIGGLILLLGIGAAGTFAWRNFSQASQASAEAMPASTLFYASLDAINLLDPTALRRFGDAFQLPDDEGQTVPGSPDDLYGEFDERLAPFGITFEEDIQTWIGRSIGAGVLEVEAQATGIEPTAFIIVAEIRDRDAADAFLEKFSAENDTTSAEYDGVDYLTETTISDGTLLLGRSDSLMLWASSAAAIEQAIDAQRGESLVSLPSYSDVLAKLPEQRAVTFMMTPNGYDALQREAASNAEYGLALGGTPVDAELLTETVDGLGFAGMEAAAASLNISGNGIELDMASLIDRDSLSEIQQTALNNIDTYENSQAAAMPVDTVLYFGAPGLGHSWERMKLLATSGVNAEDFEDSLTLAEQTLGFNIETDFMAQLQGDFGFAVHRDPQSALAQFFGAELGIMMMNGVVDSAEMGSINDKLAEALTANGASTTTINGLINIGFLDANIATFGVANNSFAIGTSADLIAQAGSGESLADTPLYTRAANILPSDMKLMLFADVGAITALAANSPADLSLAEAFAARVPAIVMGMASDETGGTAKMVLMVQESAETE